MQARGGPRPRNMYISIVWATRSLKRLQAIEDTWLLVQCYVDYLEFTYKMSSVVNPPPHRLVLPD
jgi:hypothetical protein